VGPLLVVLGLFAVGGIVQAVLAGRLVDLIHGGPGRREGRGRRMDVMVLRVAGGFVAVLAAAGMVALATFGGAAS
jgi:hypothetical protein